MGLSVGIVGLPNVGKSTLFNALTKAQNAQVANYPFCTIEPNRAIVPVPDERLEKLAALVKPQKITPATVEFVDIAGLVRGASRGEGLGNQFLANIRETAAIVHVVRCFEDPNIVHVHAHPDPKDDIEVITLELVMADLQQLEKKIERLQKQLKGDKKIGPFLDAAEALKTHLAAGNPIRTYPHLGQEEVAALCVELRFLTAKPTIYAANVDEDGLLTENPYVREVQEIAEAEGAEWVKICARLEADMAGMSDEERHAFLKELGVEELGLEQVIHKGYHALGLISFFTAGPKEVRAWTIPRGTHAAQAAGTIHTDFERGFIRAEVIHYTDYLAHGGEQGARHAGVMRLEGRDYVVQDGDVIYFRFNV
jgi:hypothetical protein